MKSSICAREPEVVAAVLAGCFSDSLRAHADGCAACGEVARVAALVHDDFSRAQREANVPTADAVWLRARLRAREEATRMAARPILFTHAVAIAALVGLLVSAGSRFSLGSWMPLALDGLPLRMLLPLVIALATSAILAPVALYIAFSRD
jgi:hypothetical protein